MKIKRMVAGLICSCMLGIPVQAQTEEPQLTQDLPAKSYILIESSTGKVLAQKNADEQMPPASITKIMTMLLLMERIDAGEISLDDTVTASEHASSMGGTQIWLEPGEEMSVNDLLKATAINSANDAAVALGEKVAGTEEQFVSLMNKRAQELGMENTVFHNATGLDADGHLSTARDISIMGRGLLKHPAITQFTSIYMDSLRNGETGLVNTNKLVRFYDGCNGLKTGTTDGAGSCLCASAERNGLGLIAVSMGSDTSKDRFNTCRSLLDFGFANWNLVAPELGSDVLTPVGVENGQLSVVDVTTKDGSNTVLVPKGGGQIEPKVELESSVAAPVTKGQKLGTVTYIMNGEQIASQDLVAAYDVPELNFGFIFSGLFRNLFGAGSK